MARHESFVPGPISRKLSSLESHVRRLKLLRGSSIFAIVVATAFAAGFLLDIIWENSVATRLAILGGVLLACGGGAFFCLVRPFFRRYSSEELAAVVERRALCTELVCGGRGGFSEPSSIASGWT